MIYLDNAATTLIKPSSVGMNMQRALHCCGSPGRGGHRPSMNAAEVVYACRESASRLFNVKNPEHIIFTGNATHSLNIAVHSLVAPSSRVVISGFEHNAVTRPLAAIGADVVVAGRKLFDPEDTLFEFEKALKHKTDAVICTHVSNAFGYVLPIEEIAMLCRKRGVPLIIDASQSAGNMPIDAGKLHADYIAMPGHKGLYGPQGTGILICSEEADPFPFLRGGTGGNSLSSDMPDLLPDKLEAGTHNVPGIAGLDAGMRYVLEKTPQSIAKHESKLIKSAVRGLSRIKEVTVFAPPERQKRSGVLSFILNSFDPETAAEMLAKQGICVRAGLHCAPTAHISAGTAPHGTVRLSVSAFTSENDIEQFLLAVKNIANGKRKRS